MIAVETGDKIKTDPGAREEQPRDEEGRERPQNGFSMTLTLVYAAAKWRERPIVSSLLRPRHPSLSPQEPNLSFVP